MALLIGVSAAVGARGEEVDIQPQAQPRQPGDRSQSGSGSNSSSNNRSGNNNSGNNRDNNREQQPQTVVQQQQAIKRELRAAKSDPSQTAPIRDGRHQFQLKVPNYVAIRNRNIVMQQRDYSCGAACLATICRYYWGDDVTEDQVLTTLDLMLTAAETEDRIKNGLAMSDLRRAAVKLGYQSVVGTTTFDKLREMKVPAIVGIEPNGNKHFVVLKGVFGDYVYLADPIRGNIRMPNWEFICQWQKKAILVVHKPGQKVKEYSALSITEADILRTQLNDQIIRSQESRQPQNGMKLNP
ncbi:MAG: C39 family peptidase [Pirellulales bacterium]